MYEMNESGEFKYITFPVLNRFPKLLHCFTTRFGGVSEGPFASMNMGTSTGDDIDKVYANYAILADKLSIKMEDIVKTNQTHTANIRYVTLADKGKNFRVGVDFADVDGLMTDEAGIPLVTTHADCTPVLIYDSVKNIAGVAHAGWRGTVKNIAGNMVSRFVNDFGSDPADISAAIGPSLGQCCFEVDEDVAEVFLNADIKYEAYMKKRGVKYYIDLWGINEYLLLKEGVREENIDISNLCTKCRNDMFFSHRGQNGKRGVMAAVVMLRE